MYSPSKYAVLALFLWHFAVSGAHPVHVTVLNMQYMEGEKRFEIMFRINKEDLQLAVFHNYEPEAIAATNDTSRMYALEQRYIRNMFKVSVNDTSLNDSLVFQQKVDDIAWSWIYIDIPLIEEPRVMKMENMLMLDLFFDQANLVICSVRGKEYSWSLSYEKPAFDIIFE